MKRLLPFALLGVSATALITGCGQKGPLYMPDQATEIVTRPTQTPAVETPPDANVPQGSAPPAPAVTTPDKDKKNQGASTPR